MIRIAPTKQPMLRSTLCAYKKVATPSRCLVRSTPSNVAEDVVAIDAEITSPDDDQSEWVEYYETVADTSVTPSVRHPTTCFVHK